MMTDLLVSSVVGLLAALIGAAVVVTGWKVAHRQEMDRDRATKRRELKVQYLINAYRRLEYVSNRPITADTAPDFERAIADIQLFGSRRQVDLAQAFAAGLVEKGTHELDSLISDLRQSLRNELDLEAVPPGIKYLRFSFPSEKDQSPIRGRGM